MTDKTKTQMTLLKRLLRYSDRYEINIQFWPKQTSVYISKDDIDLTDFGGDFDFAIGAAVKFLDRINKVDHGQH